MWNLIRFSGFYSSILRSREEDGRSEASGPSCRVHSGPEAVPDNARILSLEGGRSETASCRVHFGPEAVPGDAKIPIGTWKKAGVLRQLVCLLIESDALTSSAIYGSVYGLVVITVERYVKIVHPVAHRNHYRRWMTRVGVATPWLIGLLTSSVPSLTTAKFVNGRCTTHVSYTTLLMKSN